MRSLVCFAPVSGQASHRSGPGGGRVVPPTGISKVLCHVDCGTVKALTPVHVTSYTGLPAYLASPSWRSAPNHPAGPLIAFTRHQQRERRFSDFVMNEKTRRTAEPNRVRYPTDRHFVSGCSPPHLAVTQLPSTSGVWLTPRWTYTTLTKRLRGRTHPLEEGDPCIFNYLKRMDFAPLPDMTRLRGNDTQVLSRLFAVASRIG